jgi:DNA-binding winged helix-turn-helix (wHTH) protein/TolB-like protein
VGSRVRFGVFEFDPDTGELTRGGVPQRLQPQPARVLAVLLEQPGEIVSRDALRQRIWSEGTFVDFERGLNFCIAQIRSALGDSAESPRFIETLPRRGYRFLGPVTIASGVIRHGPFTEPISEPAPARPSRRRVAVGIAVSLLLGTLAAFAAWRVTSQTGGVRIAVVPFDNETGDQRMDDVAVAIADATVARLATPERVGRLSVIGNSAALRKPRAFRDIKAIGREVQADYIVLAQMKADASHVRLIAHLIRISDESHLWARTFDRETFTLEAQGEIAETIAAEVSSRLAAR